MAHHLKDLTIELDEKVGTVAAAAEALGKAGVNIEGICGFVVGGKGVGHVLVEDAGKARQALQSAGARVTGEQDALVLDIDEDRKSTRLNSSHSQISYAVFCLKKK